MNASMHFEDSGTGLPIILLHPVGLDRRFWGPLPALCAKSHRVITVDLPGHGSSEPAARPGRMANYVEAVADLIGKLDSGPVAVLGLSFGGMIAQNVALRYPSRISRLIICGCPGRVPDTRRDEILARARDAEAGGMQAVVQATLERWFTPSFLDSETVSLVRKRLENDDVSGWCAAWEAISEHDALTALSGIEVPTLVVAGENDAATPRDASKALTARIPHSELAVLPGAPHMMQLETPDAFAASVLNFVTARSHTAR